MKKLFSLILILGFLTISFNSPAQLLKSKVSADTTIDAATVYVTYATIESNITAIQATVTKVSGTVAGYVILQGTVDGTNYQDVNTDTLTLTNTTTNFKIWTIDKAYYAGYRIKHVGSGTQRSIAKFSFIRRS